MSDYDLPCPRCGRTGLIHAMAEQCYNCDEDEMKDEEVKKIMCSKCDKKTEHNHKFRIKNIPFFWALACDECGMMVYY